MWAKQKQSGFTIVELLIVIVVIAILAAITIVSYNGIQNRSKNQQTVTAVRAYYTALQAYAVDNNGVLPTNTGCLGPQTFYDSNPCYIGGSTYNYNTGLNNALSPYISNVPSFPAGRADSGSNSASGIFYYPSGAYMSFPIFGTDTCPGIAGATPHAASQAGADMICRIKFPNA